MTQMDFVDTDEFSEARRMNESVRSIVALTKKGLNDRMTFLFKQKAIFKVGQSGPLARLKNIMKNMFLF